MRSHRVFMVLADKLAQQGVPTLRFDYHGTGDSPGDDLVGETAGWMSDILSAHRKLESLAEPAKISWIGLRLGAMLAASASAKSPSLLDSLVLWEPVLDGRSYLRSLSAANRKTLMQGFSMNISMYRELQRKPVTDDPEEVIGFALSPALREQLRAWTANSYRHAVADRISFVTSDMEGTRRVQEILAGSNVASKSDLQQLDLRVDWATNDASGGTIVPSELVKLLLPSVLGVLR